MRIFFVTDLHGSEICWRKFLNAGAFFDADVVVLGGDITGKAMVPIVQRPGGSWDASLQDRHETLETEGEVEEFGKRVMNRGYYPIRVSEEEYRALQADEELVDKRFKEVMLEGTERWIAMAEDRLAGTGIRVVACPANDDVFEIDDLLAGARVVETGDEDHPIELGDFTMVSMGWTNPTPWHTFREAEEPELARRIERALAHAGDPSTTIFNFHAPPHGSKLDNPALPAAALPARPYPREQGLGQDRQHARAQPGQRLRGRGSSGGDREPPPQEAEGQDLSAGQRLDVGGPGPPQTPHAVRAPPSGGHSY